MAVSVCVGVDVAVCVSVGVCVNVGVDVDVSVAVAVGGGVGVSVGTGVLVTVSVAVLVAVSVGLTVFVAVAVGGTGVAVSTGVSVGATVAVCVAVSVAVALADAVAVASAVAVAGSVGMAVLVDVPLRATRGGSMGIAVGWDCKAVTAVDDVGKLLAGVVSATVGVLAVGVFTVDVAVCVAVDDGVAVTVEPALPAPLLVVESVAVADWPTAALLATLSLPLERRGPTTRWVVSVDAAWSCCQDTDDEAAGRFCEKMGVLKSNIWGSAKMIPKTSSPNTVARRGVSHTNARMVTTWTCRLIRVVTSSMLMSIQPW